MDRNSCKQIECMDPQGEPVSLEIPQQFLPRLIGKKGITIKQLMSSTGALIKVRADTDGVEKVYIYGDEANQNSAVDLINAKMAQWELGSKNNWDSNRQSFRGESDRDSGVRGAAEELEDQNWNPHESSDPGRMEQFNNRAHTNGATFRSWNNNNRGSWKNNQKDGGRDYNNWGNNQRHVGRDQNNWGNSQRNGRGNNWDNNTHSQEGKDDGWHDDATKQGGRDDKWINNTQTREVENEWGVDSQTIIENQPEFGQWDSLSANHINSDRKGCSNTHTQSTVEWNSRDNSVDDCNGWGTNKWHNRRENIPMDKGSHGDNKTQYGSRAAGNYQPRQGGYRNRSQFETQPRGIPTTTAKAPIDWDRLKKQQDEALADELAKLIKIQKDFYKEHPEISSMTPEEIEIIREKNNNIMVSRKNPELHLPRPVTRFYHAFEDFPEILQLIQEVGFSTPTPIQIQAWPILLQGLDMIGVAQTGSGKTLAYLLPALIHVAHQPDPDVRRKGPMVLVLAPTRELASQIESEVRKYSYRGVRSLCVYGGTSRSEQIHLLQSHVDIVIATPGRLNDLKQDRAINLSNVSYVVLDEADRMLDMGFEPQIRKSFIGTRPDRQTIMTTATWPEDAERISKSFMTDPVHVIVGSLDLTACHSVEQEIYVIEEGEKFDTLMSYLQNMKPGTKTIVFMRKKAHVEHYATELVRMGVDCESIHGGYPQAARDDSLHYFKTGVTHTLIATDLASRGLDICDIDCVFNYDFPTNIEEYVHRIGRTGRAGRSGRSITLFTWQDRYHGKELIRIMEEANQPVPNELKRMEARTKPKPIRPRYQ